MKYIFIIIFAFTNTIMAQNKNNHLTAIAEITVKASTKESFEYIVPVDLTHIFKGYKSFAPITKTSIKDGWNKAGLERTVYFGDGTTAKEKLLTVEPNSSFSYHVFDFTSQLRHLAKRIEGDWVFTDLGNGSTKITWNYKIIPKNFLTRFIIKVFAFKDINGMQRQAMEILENDLNNLPENTK